MITGAIQHSRAYPPVSSGFLSRGRLMPHRRTIKKGSFGGHFDELVTQFPEAESRPRQPSKKDSKLREKLDIHAALFEQAWRMERRDH